MSLLGPKMTAALLPNAKAQFIDSTGKPLAGGKVYFYIPNTSTPKDTYQDSAQTILNTNPIVLDASGQALIWGSGTYRQVVYDQNGNLLWDQITADANAGITGSITDVTFVSGTDFTPGATTQLTLPSSPVSPTNLWLFFDSTFQGDDQYAVSGTTITFNSAIPVGVGKVYAKIGSTVSVGSPGAGTVTDATVATNAGINTSKLSYTAPYIGAVARTQTSKNADLPSAYDFGAKGNGVTDDTAALQALLNVGGNVVLPGGNFLCTAPLQWTQDNTILQGYGRSKSIINFNFSGTAAFISSAQGVTQRFYCGATDVQFIDNGGVGTIIDLKDMMFSYFGRCFTFGKAGVSSIGLKMWSTNSALQSTYNVIDDHYSGNVQYGIYLTDGANSNVIRAGRIQSGVANAIGVLLAPTAFNLVNGNTVIGLGVEQPGNTLTGIQCNGNTSGTTIISPRLEQLLNGIVISSSDVGISIINPYFDSCTNNLLDNSSQGAVLINSGALQGHIQAPVSFNYIGATNTTVKSVGCSVSKAATGQYQISFTKAFSSSAYMPSINSDAFMMRIVIVNSSTVQIFTYNASAVAADANLYGSILG